MCRISWIMTVPLSLNSSLYFSVHFLQVCSMFMWQEPEYGNKALLRLCQSWAKKFFISFPRNTHDIEIPNEWQALSFSPLSLSLSLDPCILLPQWHGPFMQEWRWRYAGTPLILLGCVSNARLPSLFFSFPSFFLRSRTYLIYIISLIHHDISPVKDAWRRCRWKMKMKMMDWPQLGWINRP